MIVLITHAMYAFQEYHRPPINPLSADFWSSQFSIMKYTPLHIFASGPAAILLFFVLSGYMLVLALDSADGNYRAFVTRRLARLYPPLIVATLLAALLYTLSDKSEVSLASDWFNTALWTHDISPALLVGHLLLLDTPELNSVNVVVWTLAHELRIILVFPMIVWALRRDTRLTLVGSAAAAVAAQLLSLTTPPEIDSWLMTIHYAWLFAAGAAVAIHEERVRSFVAGIGPRAYLAAWGVTLMLIALPIANWSTIYYGGPAGVAMLILCNQSLVAQRFLTVRPQLFFGSIFYSLYLIHLPVMLAAVHGLGGMVPLPTLLLASGVISIGLAWAGHRFIERPAQRWGRRLSARPAAMTLTRSASAMPKAAR